MISFRCVIVLFILFIGQELWARPGEKLPLFELGVGGGFGVIPDYPASDNARLRGLLVPFAIYRGQIVKSDRDGGVRTRLLKGSSYEVNFSFSGSFPSDSEEGGVRQGMPDLDWLFEIGPQFKLLFWQPGDRYRFEFHMPVRAVYSSNFTKTVDRGFVFNPELRFQLRDTPYDEANLLFILSSYMGTERINDYFYEVKPEFANLNRPEFRAKEGYIGSTFTIGQSFPLGDLTLYLMYSLSSYGGSTNKASPLYKKEWNQTYGMGLLFNFYASEEEALPPSQ